MDEPPVIPLFNSTNRKNETSSVHSNFQNSQTIPYTSTPFSFINPLIYQQYSHLFNQFLQTNSHLPQLYNRENSYYSPNIQLQDFTSTNVNTSMSAGANMNTNMNVNANTNTNTNVNTNMNTNMNANTDMNTNMNINTTIQDMNIIQDSITIEQFLENLDKEYGTGVFTKYLDNFKEQEVDVLDIVNLKDNDWITLGIEKIGPRSKMIRALEKYDK